MHNCIYTRHNLRAYLVHILACHHLQIIQRVECSIIMCTSVRLCIRTVSRTVRTLHIGSVFEFFKYLRIYVLCLSHYYSCIQTMWLAYSCTHIFICTTHSVVYDATNIVSSHFRHSGCCWNCFIAPTSKICAMPDPVLMYQPNE